MPSTTNNKTSLSRISSFFRKEYLALTASKDITLEQLYHRLLAISVRDRKARTKFEEMMFLMALDIKDSVEFPLDEGASKTAKPMTAWLERYKYLDTYLRRSSSIYQ